MYTTHNFKTKKALKQAVSDHQLYPNEFPPVRIFQPGPFGGNEPKDGTVVIEGPHYPEPHRFYAQATLKDGLVVKVK